MTSVLPWRSIRAHGLYQARGLDSPLDQQGRSGVDLGEPSPPEEQKETLARHPWGWRVSLWLRGCTASSQPRRPERPALTSQLTGYAIEGLGHGAGPGGRGDQKSSDQKQWRAGAHRKPGAPARTAPSHLFLLQRKVCAASCQAAPGPAPPRLSLRGLGDVARVQGCTGRAESQVPIRPVSQELLRQAKQRGWEE